MKNFILLAMLALIAYSCVQSKPDKDVNEVAQERIKILAEAEVSTNPAILKQAKIIEHQIEAENKRIEEDLWIENNKYWITAGLIFGMLVVMSIFKFFFTGRWI